MNNKVKLLRLEKGLKQKEMAELLEMNHSTYVSKELGDRRFNIYEAIKLAEIFDCNVEDIFLDN